MEILYKIVICFIAGMGAGLGTGFAGMSAAAVISPMLITFLGMPAYDAVGIALASDVLASAVSAYTYGKNKNLDIKNGLVMMITVLIFTFVGSFVASKVPNSTMGSFSTCMTLLVGIKFIVKPVMTTKEKMASVSPKKRFVQSVLSGMIVGFICGFIGAGGAFFSGGGDALFENCVIRTVDNHIPHSYVTAPSGKADGLGFVFWNCDLVSDCPPGSVYLGRPWRPEGKTAVLDCRLGAHIAPEGFIAWNDRTDTGLASFAEADSTGPGAAERPAWVKQLSGPEAAELLARARTLCRPKTN